MLPETDGPLTAEDSTVTYSQAFDWVSDITTAHCRV